MLAEKFFLVLEALIKGQADQVPTYSDGGPRVVSSSSHVPMLLPARSPMEDGTGSQANV